MHLYIHIPFCESKCPYCAFGSSERHFNRVKSYFSALYKEIKSSISTNSVATIKTLFIGGGTPSAVDAAFYEPIMEILRPFMAKNAELTSEANPNSADIKWLENMHKMGFNRISFGAQSFSEKKLKMLGRIHDSVATKNAVLSARAAGFKNINLDIIYSTCLDSKKLLDFELESLNKLHPSHISAYSLTLESGTPFEFKAKLKKDSAILAKYLFKGLNEIGYKQYEISNFAKNVKHRCRHNLSYWRGDDYLGFGAFAVATLSGKNGKTRFYSPQNIDEYIANPLFKKAERLSADDIASERLFLGLRSLIGVPLKSLNSTQLNRAKILLKSKKVYIKRAHLHASNLLLADEIFLFLSQN